MYGNIKLIHVKTYLYGTLCVSGKKELALPHTCIYIGLFTISFEISLIIFHLDIRYAFCINDISLA
jgi:hypothetical protein